MWWGGGLVLIWFCFVCFRFGGVFGGVVGFGWWVWFVGSGWVSLIGCLG